MPRLLKLPEVKSQPTASSPILTQSAFALGSNQSPVQKTRVAKSYFFQPKPHQVGVYIAYVLADTQH